MELVEFAVHQLLFNFRVVLGDRNDVPDGHISHIAGKTEWFVIDRDVAEDVVLKVAQMYRQAVVFLGGNHAFGEAVPGGFEQRFEL